MGIFTSAPCPFVCRNVNNVPQCTGMCTPGSIRCAGANGKTQQLCDPDGNWRDNAFCTFVCDTGMCKGVCNPGDQRCSGNQPQICDSTGQWVPNGSCSTTCLDGGVCSGGG
jgi:hypothetical protein